MKILILDIETEPHKTYTWGLFNQNIGITQIEEPGRMLCFAAQWYGEREVMFWSTHHDGRDAMVQSAWALLDEADALVTYNGDKFDIPHLNREFLEAGLLPPAPYASIDLIKTVRRQFKNASNKLDWVVQRLGLGAKTSHPGFQLWLDCMAGLPSAWALMKRYNCQDVRITSKLYKKLLPWIMSHPNVSLHEGNTSGCKNCGSFKYTLEGNAYTSMGVFKRMRCKDCGKWRRGNVRIMGATSTDVR